MAAVGGSNLAFDFPGGGFVGSAPYSDARRHDEKAAMELLQSPIIGFLAVLTAVLFTTVAAMVPPNAGNFVGGLFMASMASFLAPEDPYDAYEDELEDSDI